MPHSSFGTVRQTYEREPITFDFGLYGEETFTVNPEPSLGDTFDLYDAPEPTPTNTLETTRVLARFISRLLDPADRPRFFEALYKIPSTRADIVIECATWISEQITPFESPPPSSSSGGRRTTGTRSKKKQVGSRSS